MSVLADIKTRFRPSSARDISQAQTVTTPATTNTKKWWRRGKPLSRRAKILLLVLISVLTIPLVTMLVGAIDGLLTYNQAHSGLTHLQNAQNAFKGGAQGDTAKYFDIDKLHKAQQEIDAAHSDFVGVSNSLDHDGLMGMFGTVLPQQVSTARSLSHIGVDATEIMQQLVKSAIKLSPTIGPGLASSPVQNQTDPTPYTGPLQPLITPDGLNEIQSDIDFALPLVHDMNKYAAGVSPGSLPLSASQQQLVTGLVALLPGIETSLKQARSMMGDIGWLLGVGGERHFLVETLDTGELRGGGGFTGQFGTLRINGGHALAPKFQNIGIFEQDHTLQGTPLNPVFAKVSGQKAPNPYGEWWAYANFGLRDANISADFPTSAHMEMDAYTHEFGGDPLDGVINFSPYLIQHVLTVTGPITIPQYNETITAQNLIDRLHYYQLDNAGIRKEEIVEHVEDPQAARKLFTGRVTSGLISAIQHLPANKLQSLVDAAFLSLKSKDLQIYVTNPQVQGLVAKYGATGTMDRSTNHDGLYLVQANLSASKASVYVNTTVNDTIALDASGGAQHTMQVKLDYQKKGDVYGFDTYSDYVRVYTPPSSQYKSGDGFEQPGKAWCGSDAGYKACPTDVYGDGSLTCPANTTLGLEEWRLYDPYAFQIHPLDRIGPPTNLTSDESDRAMYGGWAIVPKNCTLTFKLSWYVPPANNSHPYSLLIQRQASTFNTVNLTIQPAPGTCSAPLHYSGTMNDLDRLFTIQNSSGSSNCSLQTTDKTA